MLELIIWVFFLGAKMNSEMSAGTLRAPISLHFYTGGPVTLRRTQAQKFETRDNSFFKFSHSPVGGHSL